ncbi:MAG TPA: hypothetical protein VND54_08515 [Candidatus Saccharimonadales bacterium]|nr:hypothetical protein [Candidatus Saccharimonadales bacterium]
MRLGWRDLAGTALVAALGVLYLRYLANGSVLFISDSRAMAATGLVLGWAACMVAAPRFVGAGSRAAIVLLSAGGVATLGLGVAAIVVGTNSALLAAFIAAIVAMWALTLLRHAVGSITAGGTTSRHLREGV